MLRNVYGWFTTAILGLYRVFAITALVGVLVGAVLYSCFVGFYLVNNTWVAPTVIHAQDQATLEMTERLLTLHQAISVLNMDINKNKATNTEMEKHLNALSKLQPAMDKAVPREQSHQESTGLALSELDVRKKADNVQTESVLAQVQILERNIDKELAMGLITKGDATLQRSQLNTMKNAVTDGQVDEVLLQDQLLRKNKTGTAALDLLDKQATLSSQVATLRYQIVLGEEQIQEDQTQLEQMQVAVGIAQQTPYYKAFNGEAHFAFVPYDNKKAVKVGEPLYDCYLNFVACRKVGTVKEVYPSEIKLQIPVFHTDTRGFLIELGLTNPASALSTTLFLGRKPLFF